MRRPAELLLEVREIRGVDHASSVRGRSARPHGETGGVRKLVVIVVVVILAILFVQPIRAYRSAKAELATARTQLQDARAAKVRAIAEREALGTKAVLVREARRRGYIFPGETPFSIANR